MTQRTFYTLLSAAVVLASSALIDLGRPVLAFSGCCGVRPRSVVGVAAAPTMTASAVLASAIVVDEATVANAKSKIEESIKGTDAGRSIDPNQRAAVHSLLSDLESLNSLPAPARDPRMNGPWVVLYTDAPPPSNGRLGFLNGVAKQVIDLEKGRYRNELYVGGSGEDGDEGAWLSAVLDATWTEWNGVYLDLNFSSVGDDAVGQDGIDHGATTWKVDFESLTLSLFGVPLFTQKFKEGTSRTWKMTYLDDDTRIVRAGKTGRGEDDWVFYMRRGSSSVR